MALKKNLFIGKKCFHIAFHMYQTHLGHWGYKIYVFLSFNHFIRACLGSFAGSALCSALKGTDEMVTQSLP